MTIENHCHMNRHGRGPHEPIETDDNTPSVVRGNAATSRDGTEVFKLQFCRRCGAAFLTVEPA